MGSYQLLTVLDLAQNGIKDDESQTVQGLDTLGGGRLHAAGKDMARLMIHNAGARQHNASR